MKRPRLLVALWLSCSLAGGCALVPQNRRARLADPMMAVGDEATTAYRKHKLYDTREAAAGGDGAVAGGGCGCQ